MFRLNPVMKSLLSKLSLLLFVLLFISGCGSTGDEALDGAANQPNTFGRNSVTADEEIVENGTSNTTSCTGTATSGVTYCLAVEATDAMLASWKTELFNLITPSKAYAFRGLTTVPAKTIEIIQVDENLNQLATSLVPSYTVNENSALGTYSITFSEAPPSRVDIIARVTLDNGQVLFAPFIDSNIDVNFQPIVIVNVVSDYLVKQLFNQLSTPEQLGFLLPCNDGGSQIGNNVGCKNQPFGKFSLWGALNGLTQSYEIDIPSTYTITQARELLDNTAEFKKHIDTALNEILRVQEPFVGGTERELAPITENPDNTLENLSSIESYNSSLFTLAFNQINPDSSSKSASISTAISVNLTENADAVSYPELTRNTSNLYVTLTSINEDFPFARTSLLQTPSNEITLAPSITNALSAAPGNTFLTTQGSYVAGKVPFQTITDKTETTAVGWQRDPFTQLLYSSDADEGEPKSLLSSFVSNGSSYAISSNSDATWARDSKLEEQNMFSWVVHNQVPEDSDGNPISKPGEGFVDTSEIEGKSYGVISFSVKLNDSGNIVTNSGQLSKWIAAASQLNETQPAETPAGGENHYESYSFSRDESQALNVSGIATAFTPFSRDYAVAPSVKSSSETPQLLHLGRLTVSAPTTSEVSQASSTPNGGMITITQDEVTAGQGLIQATELRTITPTDMTGLVYRLSGNSFGANAASNVLRNYNNSTIEITSSTSATLTFNTIETTHNVSTQVVSGITNVEIPQAPGSYVIDQGVIQFTFPNVQGETLKLKGFMSKSVDSSNEETTKSGNLMTLLMIHDYDNTGNTQATIGLIYGFKELSLPVEIE